MCNFSSFSLNAKLFYRAFAVVSAFAFLAGCASSSLHEENTDGSHRIRIKAEKGRVELTDWHAETSVKRTGEDRISRSDIESVSFRTQVKTVSGDAGDRFEQEVSVVSKTGDIDLHEMAFPELGETMAVTVTSTGKVLKAGSYPPDSIFYVPQISLPERSVRVGESWDLDASWVGAGNGIPMHLHLVTVLKRVIPCGQGPCFDLEVNGDVTIPSLAEEIQLKNTITGRLLFSSHLGTVIWSEIRSRLSLDQPEAQVEEESCIESVLREPEVKELGGLDPKCRLPLQSSIVVPL